ncbi:hypothetical protein TrVGV298_010978 [Trichoderma virens]|nr:hypothetical protein TrVGV298_010978 [Trichoderma virens]
MTDICQVGTQINYCGAFWTVIAILTGAGANELWAVIKNGLGQQQTIPMATANAAKVA